MKKLISKWWFWLIISCIFLLLVHIAYKLPAPCYWLEYTISAGELISFLGTVVLGFVAVYQTRQANAISNKLLDKEITAATPYIDLRIITEDELKQYKQHQALKCEAGDCYSYMDENFRIIESDGCDLFYKLKNVREMDILTIFVIEVEVAECQNGKKVSSERYPAANSHNRGTLSGYEEVPFITTIPHEWFAKVAAYTTEKWIKDGMHPDDITLSVEFLFRLTNNDGCNYRERISIEIINAKLDGIESFVIINKKLSKAEREE